MVIKLIDSTKIECELYEGNENIIEIFLQCIEKFPNKYYKISNYFDTHGEEFYVKGANILALYNTTEKKTLQE